jgi:Zn-dependent M28 family amino/carboxypeptidase
VRGDSIYNGALDNATGCSALLNLAHAISLLQEAPKRSILFAAVTAEESGLLGSKFFAENPTIDRKKMIANFNIDGINIWGPTNDLGMVGHGKNSLTKLAEQVAARRGRVIRPDQETDKGLFYRSDHFNFARIGVPAAYFKAGNDFIVNGDTRRSVKAAYTALHYHQPSDQIDERWSLEGAVLDTQLILECLLITANASSVPTWTPGDEFEKLR